MKKNKALRIAAALLVVVAITTCGMTGALAKYVDSFIVESATVRAGLFQVDGPTSDYVFFDATLWEGNLIAAEDHAQAYDGLFNGDINQQIIVPGSAIKVKGFKIVNYSEVDVDISFAGGIDVAIKGFEDVEFWFNATGDVSGTATALPTDPQNEWQNTPLTFDDIAPVGAVAATTSAGALIPDTYRLKSFPAAATAGDQSNELLLSDFYILWPFSNTKIDGNALGLDGIESINPDRVNVWTHDGMCTGIAGFGEDTCTGLLPGCNPLPALSTAAASDTLIGVNQAAALLNIAGANPTRNIHKCGLASGTRSVNPTTKVVTYTLGAELDLSGDEDTCLDKGCFQLNDAGYHDELTGNILKVAVTVKAVQVD